MYNYKDLYVHYVYVKHLLPRLNLLNAGSETRSTAFVPGPALRGVQPTFLPRATYVAW